MKQMACGLMLLLLMPLLTGCGVSVPTDARPVARKVRVMPDNDGATLVSEGIGSNYMDIINYSVFGVIKLNEQG